MSVTWLASIKHSNGYQLQSRQGLLHHNDVITASQITCVSIVYSVVCSGADQRKQQNSASLAFVWGIHWWPVNSPHKGPVTQKRFPFDDVIMQLLWRPPPNPHTLTHFVSLFHVPNGFAMRHETSARCRASRSVKQSIILLVCLLFCSLILDYLAFKTTLVPLLERPHRI